MDSEKSEPYFELYERYNEGRIKSEDIYGKENNDTEEKKSQSPNSELDSPSQAPNKNSLLPSNNGNAKLLNNEENALISYGINQNVNDKKDLPDKNKEGQSSDAQLLDKSKDQSTHNINNQPINFISQNNNNINDQHQKNSVKF